jgi:rhamnose utilization protein RhaD (predicted bifunctional aldolase and dehydrogenase)
MNDSELRALIALSAQLGRNPLRTQGAGGNTSLKRNGVLWVKASGTWLAEAEVRDVMVPVAIEPLLAALEANDSRADAATAFVVKEVNPSGLRPSIETSVHAAIPLPVVVHIHCVATIALGVRLDAERIIDERLKGVVPTGWTFVPYARPGLPLARAVAARLRRDTKIFVLGNHGLIVAGTTVAEVEALVERTCVALDVPRRPGRRADLGALMRLTAQSPYRLPRHPAAHDTATDPASLAIARCGSLYPDHTVFLGRGLTVLDDGAAPADVARRESAPMLAVPGIGVLIHREAARGADELARCLAEVTARIAPDAAVRYLTAPEEDALASWDAEVYRLGLAAGRGIAGNTP